MPTALKRKCILAVGSQVPKGTTVQKGKTSRQKCYRSVQVGDNFPSKVLQSSLQKRFP